MKKLIKWDKERDKYRKKSIEMGSMLIYFILKIW